MASSRSTNTMAEFLQRMMGDISEAKTLPDADLEFLIQLETTILQKLRAPVDALMGQMQGQGAGPVDQLQGAGAMMGGMPSGPGPLGVSGAPMAPNGQERVPGTRMEPAMPNPDEFRRMLGGAR